MAKPYASLEHIENDRRITRETDFEFLYRLQTGLLLALKEQGSLNETQCNCARSRLEQQRRERAKKLRQKGERE